MLFCNLNIPKDRPAAGGEKNMLQILFATCSLNIGERKSCTLRTDLNTMCVVESTILLIAEAETISLNMGIVYVR